MSVEERKFVWANFARSTLAEGVSADATELRIRALDASLFPSPGHDEVFSVVLWSEDLESFEVVYCTGRAGDLLTVERGKEGTTPRAFAAGALVVHQVTAGFFAAVQDRRYVVILSSRPYPLEVLDALDVGGVPLPGGRYDPTMVEALYVAGQPITGGELRAPLVEYQWQPAEALQVGGQPITGGELRALLVEYAWSMEELHVAGEPITGGELRVALQTYGWSGEEIVVGAQPIDGGEIV